MAARRISVLVATVALALAGLAAVSGPAAADGVITPSATSVPVGGTLTVEPSGCDLFVDDEETYTYQNAQISFVTGVGGVERAVTVGAGGDGVQVAIPGWVDPDEPAVLRGTCLETRYRFDEGTQETVTLFTYPEVTIDIIPAESAVRLTSMVLDRDTAAGGQIVEAQVSGCLPGEEVGVTVIADTDLALGGTPRHVTGDYTMVASEPTTIEIPLVDQYESGEPLADGDYVVLAVCYAYAGPGTAMWMAEPTWLYVRGTSAIGAMSVAPDTAGSGLDISGDGCVGAPVSVRIRGNEYGLEDGQIDDTLTPPVAVDGTWTASWSTEAIGFSVQIDADCGDPRTDGFRYPTQHWYENGFSEQWIGRVSPTSTPVGGHVQVHVEGHCEGSTVVQLRDDDGNTLSEGPVMAGALAMSGSAHLMAPDEPGTYQLVALCDGRPSYPDSIEVFAPTPVAPPRPLPGGPGTGWPQTGEREQFHGEIGPITLPAGHDHGMPGIDSDGIGDTVSPAGLGPSGLGIAVPRPAGDFAITSLTFDLVDEHGNPVSAHDAHLHHMVLANLNSANPACPGGTFGLPGEIIAAAGAERTAIGFGDPYGLVVEETDVWAGVYEVMNMADEEQTVFLTYDMEIRRDVENVRPVSTYFGSATGCGSFTWTIDGSGSPDQQAHYLTVANDGVLVGAGGHIHNGGLHTELYDDRGRLLCRNELVLGEHEEPEEPTTTTTTMHDHGTTTTTAHHHDDDTTTTTAHHHEDATTTTAHAHEDTTSTTAHAHDDTTSTTAVEEWPTVTSPPEMYPDDPPLEAITTCQTHEQLTAGERLLFQATYSNDRPRSGVMGIFLLYVWEGGGPVRPSVPGPRPPIDPVGPAGPGTPTSSTTPSRPGGTSTSTTPAGPGDPTDPVDPEDPTSPTDPAGPSGPGGPSSPTAPAPSAGPGSPSGVAGESATPARPASPARPYRGSASYTG